MSNCEHKGETAKVLEVLEIDPNGDGWSKLKVRWECGEEDKQWALRTSNALKTQLIASN